jgi:hypothetical protein
VNVPQRRTGRQQLTVVVALVALIGSVLIGAPTRSTAATPELVTYDGALKNGWSDLGWGPRTLNKGPAQVDVGDWQGWILGRPTVDVSQYASLSVRVRIPPGEKSPLVMVRAGYDADDQFPSNQLSGGVADAQRWVSYNVPVEKLNPSGKPFDRLLFMGTRKVAAGTIVEIDKIVLQGQRAASTSSTKGTTKPASGSTAKKTSRSASIAVNCAAKRQAISPGIYGIAFNSLTEESQTSQFTIGATSRRWGGDPTSRFNWENGNAWNPGHNWYWRNLPVLSKGNAWQTFFANNAKAKMGSALTLPMLGWIAKDTTSYSFPVSTRGAQQFTAPDLPDAGNGVAASGDVLKSPPPQQTSIAATPASAAKWVEQIRKGGFTAGSPLDMVILDNEPDLWDSSHRDIRTEPSTYDEILQKGVAYATAVRAVDPNVKIAGPASWGWWGYFYSGADAKAGFSAKPDRRAHGDIPFLEWYLTEMAKAEKASGKRLLDVLDVHYYPGGKGIYDGNGGKTDAATNELRVRSTRSLWDTSYKDESWVNDPVYLLPRLADIVANTKPGIGISIGEYNFGGDAHVSGAVAQAEALGRFGQFGLTSAYLWTHPKQNSEQYWGFRAFRNYDGKGSSFGTFSVQGAVSGSGTKDLSVFASSDALTKQKTIVLVNRSSSVAFNSTIKLEQCVGASSASVWSYAGGPQGYTALPAKSVSQDTFTVAVAPWSIQVIRVE